MSKEKLLELGIRGPIPMGIVDRREGMCRINTSPDLSPAASDPITDMSFVPTKGHSKIFESDM